MTLRSSSKNDEDDTANSYSMSEVLLLLEMYLFLLLLSLLLFMSLLLLLLLLTVAVCVVADGLFVDTPRSNGFLAGELVKALLFTGVVVVVVAVVLVRGVGVALATVAGEAPDRIRCVAEEELLLLLLMVLPLLLPIDAVAGVAFFMRSNSEDFLVCCSFRPFVLCPLNFVARLFVTMETVDSVIGGAARSLSKTEGVRVEEVLLLLLLLLLMLLLVLLLLCAWLLLDLLLLVALLFKFPGMFS